MTTTAERPYSRGGAKAHAKPVRTAPVPWLAAIHGAGAPGGNVHVLPARPRHAAAIMARVEAMPAEELLSVEQAAGDFVWPPRLDGYTGPRAWFPPATEADRPPHSTEPAREKPPAPELDEPCTEERLANAVILLLTTAWTTALEYMAAPGSVVTLDRVREVLPLAEDFVVPAASPLRLAGEVTP